MEELLFLSFGNFFGFFAALNLAYAGSKRFRMNLNEDILQLDKSVSALAADVTAFSKDESFQDDFKEMQGQIRGDVNSIQEKLLDEYNDFLNSYKERKSFKKKYKKMFFASSIYCVAMLLLLGFENKYPEKMLIILFYSQIVILILILYVFISGFLNKKKKSKISCPKTVLATIIIFIAYLVGVILSFIENHYSFLVSKLYTSVNKIFVISVLIAIMPYTLFFLKAYLYRKSNKKFEDEFQKKLDKADDDISAVTTQALLQYYRSAKKKKNETPQ